VEGWEEIFLHKVSALILILKIITRYGNIIFQKLMSAPVSLLIMLCKVENGIAETAETI